MTTLVKEIRHCLVCGEMNEYERVASTNRLDAPDLDTRPAEMERSTIPFWIQRCPACGYCAPQVSDGPAQAGEIVHSNPYQTQLIHISFPSLANRFLCWAMIQEACGELAQAGWACVHAAWVCDDEVATLGANLCRLKAVDFFKRARWNSAPFADEAGAEDALLADLYRRCGEFERAVTAVQVGILKKPEEMVRKILYYQVALVKGRDIACHNLDEALQFQMEGAQ